LSTIRRVFGSTIRIHHFFWRKIMNKNDFLDSSSLEDCITKKVELIPIEGCSNFADNNQLLFTILITRGRNALKETIFFFCNRPQTVVKFFAEINSHITIVEVYNFGEEPFYWPETFEERNKMIQQDLNRIVARFCEEAGGPVLKLWQED
jgi:hypothetical protein